MARARSIPDLSAEQTYADAAVRTVSVRSGELFEHAHGVLDTEDIERVHDMRVATRRLRAAMEVFEPCFPRKRYRQALSEVKRLADGLGARRDRDVAIRSLETFARRVPASDRRGVGSLVAKLREEQAEANRELGELVGGERLDALRMALRDLVAAGERRAGR